MKTLITAYRNRHRNIVYTAFLFICFAGIVLSMIALEIIKLFVI